MVFALSMADFATPAVLGGGLAFLAQDALLLVIGAEYDLAMASVLCVFLMLPSLGAFLVHHRWLAGRSYVTVTGRGPAAEPRRAVPAVDGPALAVTGLACLAVLLPMAMVVMGAVTRFVGVNNAFTLEHFANLRGLRSLELSLRMAGAAAVCGGGRGAPARLPHRADALSRAAPPRDGRAPRVRPSRARCSGSATCWPSTSRRSR